MTTLDRRTEDQKMMVHVRTDYIDRWPRVTFTALAEDHGISRQTIARVAKRERWAYHARVIHAERHLRKNERDLAFARQQAADVAAVLLRLSKAKGTTHRELERSAAESEEAHLAASNICRAASWYAHSVRALRAAKADMPFEGGHGFRHGLRKLTTAEYGGVGRWPMFADDPPRKPFPWEKRTTS